MTRSAALLTRKGLTLVPIILFVPTGMVERFDPFSCGIYPMAARSQPAQVLCTQNAFERLGQVLQLQLLPRNWCLH